MTQFYITFSIGQFSSAKPVYYGPFESYEVAEQLFTTHGWVYDTTADAQPYGRYDGTGYHPYVKYGNSLKLTRSGHEVGKTKVGHGLYVTSRPFQGCEIKTPEQLIAERLYPEESSLKYIIEDWSKGVSEAAKVKRLREAKEERGRLGVLDETQKIEETESIIRQLRYCLERCPKAPV